MLKKKMLFRVIRSYEELTNELVNHVFIRMDFRGSFWVEG